jgi:hypothetical protein
VKITKTHLRRIIREELSRTLLREAREDRQARRAARRGGGMQTGEAEVNTFDLEELESEHGRDLHGDLADDNIKSAWEEIRSQMTRVPESGFDSFTIKINQAGNSIVDSADGAQHKGVAASAWRGPAAKKITDVLIDAIGDREGEVKVVIPRSAIGLG